MPLIRDPGQRADLYPEGRCRCSTGCRKELAAGRRTARRSTGRYVRIELPGRNRTLTLAEVEVYSDGRNVARAGQGHAEEHRLRRRRRAGHRRQHERQLRRRRPDPHARKTPHNPWWEVDLGAEHPDRARSSSTTAPTATSASASTASPSRSSTATTTVVFEQDEPAGPDREGAYAGRRRVAGAAHPPRGDERPDVGARQGDRDVQGRSRRSCKEDADRDAADPGAAAHPRRRTGRRKQAKPLLDDVLAYIRKVPAAGADLAGGARRHAAGRRAGGAPAAGRGEAGPQGAGRAGRAGDPPVAR